MRRPRAAPRRQSGFTILEVLTAFVVFAVTLAALLQVFSGGLRDAQIADEYARAVIVAQSRLAAHGAAERVEEGSTSGTEGDYAWTVTAEPYDERLESPEADTRKDYNLRVRLLRVESRVSWQAADGRVRDVRLATLALGMKP
jgi:general secretion pathway protein I